MKAFVTGGAGFIGSNLSRKLLSEGFSVVCFDNFCSGFEANIKAFRQNSAFKVIVGDLTNKKSIVDALETDVDIVFHLAANADVRFGFMHPERDLQQNTVATFNVLEAMREKKVSTVVFSSTGSVYGEPDIFPTPENAPFPVQTSLYAASKLACEALIQAYSSGYNFKSYIFRFVSLMGKAYSHGHVVDFYDQLKSNPKKLDVLGDGNQSKSYLHVEDCIDAILLAIKSEGEQSEIYNLGTDDFCTVKQSIKWIEETLGTNATKNFDGQKRGWIGDSPKIYLDTKKIRKLGWTPSRTIEQSVKETVSWISENEWILRRD